MGKFTTSARLSFLISCKLRLPNVGFKISSLLALVLKSLKTLHLVLRELIKYCALCHQCIHSWGTHV
jgi:recombinational DNA repair protein RecR